MKEKKLAWAILLKNGTAGRNEVIKVTNHEEADRVVKNAPSLYYKSGPFVLT